MQSTFTSSAIDRTVHTCYGQSLNGFLSMGRSTMIAVQSNNASLCGPFTITATM
jgi:hypothetical protein